MVAAKLDIPRPPVLPPGLAFCSCVSWKPDIVSGPPPLVLSVSGNWTTSWASLSVEGFASNPCFRESCSRRASWMWCRRSAGMDAKSSLSGFSAA